MTEIRRPITGRCLCGGVTYSADAEPVVQATCHCTDCQRQTGSPFSVIVGVPRGALEVEGTTLSSFSTTGEDHGSETERSFCAACGSPLFSVGGGGVDAIGSALGPALGGHRAARARAWLSQIKRLRAATDARPAGSSASPRG